MPNCNALKLAQLYHWGCSSPSPAVGQCVLPGFPHQTEKQGTSQSSPQGGWSEHRWCLPQGLLEKVDSSEACSGKRRGRTGMFCETMAHDYIAPVLILKCLLGQESREEVDCPMQIKVWNTAFWIYQQRHLELLSLKGKGNVNHDILRPPKVTALSWELELLYRKKNNAGALQTKHPASQIYS